MSLLGDCHGPRECLQAESRCAPRYVCLEPPAIRVSFKPRFRCWRLHVLNVSLTGIGLLSDLRINPGERLLLLWAFGPREQWFSRRATVIHATHRREGGCVIGCELAAPLADEELQAFFEDVGEVRLG